MSLQHPSTTLLPWLVALFAVSALACASGTGGGESEPDTQTNDECTEDEEYNSIIKRCVAKSDNDDNNGGDDAGADVADTSMGNNGGEDTSDPDDADENNSDPDDVMDDVMVDVEDATEDEPDPECDQDQDGVLSFACGGMDCDDENFFRNPERRESCDQIDNDCNGSVNDGVICTFYAHTGDDLYAIDPFQLTATRVGSVPRLQDIDTHPDGTLYGVTRDELYRFDENSSAWMLEGDFPSRIEDANGLAIDSLGNAFVTSGSDIYAVDLENGETNLIGPLGSGFYSSGDCVVNKRDSLFMTSKADDQPDTLVLVDAASGNGTAIGLIGYSRVFGLTSGWGNLYGLTGEGELITIDIATGQGTLLHTFGNGDIAWFGAASTPSR